MDITGIGEVADLAKTAINAIWPDKTEQEKAQLAAAVQLIQGQLDVNRAEASSPNLFVAGWRPFVGWICGTGFGVQFIFGPIGSWAASLAGHPMPFPQLDLGTMMPLLLGMLGLGGMRTAEKLQGKANGH
jgi:Holin of 3TMs, for gene-transfer release